MGKHIKNKKVFQFEPIDNLTCFFVPGTVHLLLGEELEMMIPCRPSALISLEADSTFFGVIQLN